MLQLLADEQTLIWWTKDFWRIWVGLNNVCSRHRLKRILSVTCPIFFLVSGKKLDWQKKMTSAVLSIHYRIKTLQEYYSIIKKIVYIIHFESKQKYPPQESDVKSGKAEWHDKHTRLWQKFFKYESIKYSVKRKYFKTQIRCFQYTLFFLLQCTLDMYKTISLYSL